MVRTKIICTYGPACASYTILRKMIIAGVDVVRFNFSHSKHEEILAGIDIIRKLNRKYRRGVKVLGDLQGHRIRIGELRGPIGLKKNQIFYLTQRRITGENIAYFDYTGPLKKIKVGNFVYIDDGNIALKVVGKTKDGLKTRVIVGGVLKERKGVNIPEAELEFGSISRKDVEDINFCKRNGFDYIAQSFVRNKEDVLEVRKILGEDSKCKIIAKIENKKAIENIDEILDVCDGIMIARGDLGVSLPIYQVPVVQKMLIRKAKQKNRFVITATQMLESMTENVMPTRAEVSDVANAVFDGTDFVMLSAETSVGKYPVETVRMMNEILKFTEENLDNI
jgi:pyruvate kinase